MSTMTAITSRGRRFVVPSLRAFFRQPIYVILAALLVAVMYESPGFATWPVFMAFLKRSTPLMILAAGELFVVVSGEFDLSVGALVTVVVVFAARMVNDDPTHTVWVIPLVLLIGTAVGLVNGLVTTRLRVPSFITTLGMLLILNGGILYWTGGAPSGALTSNFRQFGRNNILNVPVIEVLPYAVVILAVVGGLATWLLHRTTFGRQLFAVGGNPVAARLSGIHVTRVRTIAFVLSALFATIAGIIIGGLYPLTQDPGAGYSFQALSAVVLGGAILGGGRGSMPAAIAGALSLQALFTLLNVLGLPSSLREGAQGLIVIGAMAYAAFRVRRSA